MKTVHSSHRYVFLDGLRGVAILLVLSWNLAAQAHPQEGTFYSYLKALVRLNWSGVDLFFVLSGFLIGGILLDHRGAKNSLVVFYVRRACRIFPVYYASLLFFFLTRAWAGTGGPGWNWLFVNQSGDGMLAESPVPLASYFVHLQNFWMAHSGMWGPGWLGITWSLAVEEQFYLLLPVVILFMPRRMLPAIIAGCIGLALVFRLNCDGLARYCLLTSRMDSLMVGVGIASLLRSEVCVSWLAGRRRWILGLMLVMGCLFAGLIARPYVLGAASHTFLALFYGGGILCLLMLPQGRAASLLAARPLRWFGKISFGLYLFHEPAMGAAHAIIWHNAPRIQAWTGLLTSGGALLVSILAAWLSYECMEKHVTALGRRQQYQFTGSGVESLSA